MSVPEATVNKDNFAVPGKHQIRFSRKAVVVQPEAIAETVGDSSDAIFRLCVLLADSPHDFATFSLVVYICHYANRKTGLSHLLIMFGLRLCELRSTNPVTAAEMREERRSLRSEIVRFVDSRTLSISAV